MIFLLLAVLIVGAWFTIAPYFMVFLLGAIGWAFYCVDDPIWGNTHWAYTAWAIVFLGSIVQSYMGKRDRQAAYEAEIQAEAQRAIDVSNAINRLPISRPPDDWRSKFIYGYKPK
jgi:hypothetical protein